MIEHADKLLDSLLPEKKGILKDDYSWLSEFCHPNAYDLYSMVTAKPDRTLRFTQTLERTRSDYKEVEYILQSLIPFFLFYDRIMGMIKENENLPIVVP